ncbi:MAG: hypothetical protein GXY83_14275 [Rhodopirellula sp.]|nr:hypothetical protein [Rhodopirellula sp.]
MTWLLLAQETTAPEQISGTAIAIYLLVPVAILAISWWIASSGQRREVKPLRDRSLDHMDRLEAKADEMIALLKEISEKLDRRS